MEPAAPRSPSPALSAMTGLNVVFAIWATIGLFGLISMVKLVKAPEVWPSLAESERVALAELAKLPDWLLYGMLGSQMLKATLYCAAAFGYFTRSRRWGRWGGTALGLWLLTEQAVLFATVGQTNLGMFVAAAYGVLTLWVVHFGAREALDS
jgi:hypothetical protein